MADAPKKRRKAERRGRFAEGVAVLYLRFKGYRIVATRYKTHAGEIDIIARRGDLAVFVEVKARRAAQVAVDAVTPSAMRRIRAASDVWLSRQADAHRLSQRYDIVACLPGRLPRHFPDAF
ncbi:YraN family protein [Martelella soudanensis]|uniref:YraN family protein n=1 Tax=unclassified Martelella TaxID=2629616 RepID=UPI0015DE9A90|nr:MULTISPECIES: YraN family protein [unclassified Martelella]